jgi:hypothetical protein
MAYLPQGNVIIRLPERELRELFNALEIAKKGKERFLIRKPDWIGRRRPRHLPVGSRSRIWLYFMPHNSWLLAVAHLYLERGMPTGEPDPKEMRIDDVILRPVG